MEIKRIGENQIRCALTEEEIQDMGFEIDDIIADSEMTQKFMRLVISQVEEQEHIDMEHLSRMVRAELLQDHSMAITFGADTESSFKNILDAIGQLMNRLGKLDPAEKTGSMSRQDRQALIDEVIGSLHPEGGEEQQEERYEGKVMTCALRFETLDAVIRMSKTCFTEKAPNSSLWKLEGEYYLLLDFAGFTKSEMCPFAMGTVEYDDGHFADESRLAYVKEHGECIAKNNALQMLIQL